LHLPGKTLKIMEQPTNMAPRIQIKGIREGLLIILGDGEWPTLRAAFLEQVQQQADFLKGGRLILDVGNQVLRASELGQLRDILSDRGLSLYAVLSGSSVTQQTAQTLGLATRISRPQPERVIHPVETVLTGEQAVLLRRTLRSGFSVQHTGHVIVIGDVNPGAEIIAGGDVIVWGRLRGLVHAGAQGDENAIVCALDLSPTQLRIAGKISVTPSRTSLFQRGKNQPEMARIIDGVVIAEAWNSKSTGN
jgi:septum site-determining protein MinC